MAHMTIDELLKTKDTNEVWAVSPKAKVFEALQQMADNDIGALLVVEDDQLVGVFSERDYARKIILKGKSSLQTPVREVMTSEIFTIQPENIVEECMALMTDHHVRHLPVLDKGRLVGVVSIGDIVKAVISGQAQVITSLENYITGNDYGKV
jgi:CBS domain-containing protein